MFGNVTGHWLWIEAIGAFLLFASTFVLVQQKDLARNPPLPTIPLAHLPPPAPAKPKARLKQFGTRVAFVHVPYDSAYFTETTSNEKKALMAVFENEIHGAQTVGYIGDVTGRIRFKDEHGKEFADLRVQQGCWLQASSHEVNFPANAQHALIVAIKGYHGTQIVREAYRRTADVQNAEFKHEKLYVEVSLTSKGESLITGHYILTSTDKEFSLTQVEEYPSAPIPAQVIPQAEQLPHLAFMDAKEIFLYFDQAMAVEIPSGTNVGLVATFKNHSQDVRSKNVDAIAVTGTVEYKNKSGETEQVTCSWVEQQFQEVNIKAGRSQRLVVTFRAKPGAKIQALACDNESEPITMGRLAHLRMLQSLRWPTTKDIAQDCSEIEIVLIGNDGRTLFRGQFDFAVCDGKMTLTKK
jgi:hypothetical protein